MSMSRVGQDSSFESIYAKFKEVHSDALAQKPEDAEIQKLVMSFLSTINLEGVSTSFKAQNIGDNPFDQKIEEIFARCLETVLVKPTPLPLSQPSQKQMDNLHGLNLKFFPDEMQWLSEEVGLTSSHSYLVIDEKHLLPTSDVR